VIDYQTDGPVATVTIRRPEKHNALTAAMVDDLVAAVERAGADDDVKVVVLRGEGRSFCAGFDVSDPTDFEGSPGDPRRARIDSIVEKSEWMRRLFASRKPVVAAVHGHCIGIGTYLLLVCDFAVATTDAGIGLPEERLGSAGATWAYPFLILNVGLKRANEIVMTGRRFSAQEAREMGLVNRVVAPDELDAVVADLARALSTLPRDGLAVNRAARHLATAQLGHQAAFAFHAALHPLAEHLHREPDELDFMALVERDGMRAAVAARTEAFAGEFWGW
jgi:enoyl-CoA hydratase